MSEKLPSNTHQVYLNYVVTAVPNHDIHIKFIQFATNKISDLHQRAIFSRMAQRSQIEHRYSLLSASPNSLQLDNDNFYNRDNFPDTEKRMIFYEGHAFNLVKRALDQIGLAVIKSEITHLIITSCTGFYAPGIDIQIINHYNLNPTVERTAVGFMGCYAAFNALKLARSIVGSMSRAKVIIVNIELCTLHLKDTSELDQLLSYLIFSDGCAASIVSSEPVGIRLDSFFTTIIPECNNQITWKIGNQGFDMVLSGRVPATITDNIPNHLHELLNGHKQNEIKLWAIHPGGRSILDAVQKCLALSDDALKPSRDVLSAYGNMSSATIMFVLHNLMNAKTKDMIGCAMAFGPGITLESMLFSTTGVSYARL